MHIDQWLFIDLFIFFIFFFSIMLLLLNILRMRRFNKSKNKKTHWLSLAINFFPTKLFRSVLLLLSQWSMNFVYLCMWSEVHQLVALSFFFRIVCEKYFFSSFHFISKVKSFRWGREDERWHFPVSLAIPFFLCKRIQNATKCKSNR